MTTRREWAGSHAVAFTGGVVLGALAIVGHRRLSERRELQALLADFEEDPIGPPTMPELPERILDHEDFLATVSGVARECALRIRSVAELPPPEGADLVARLVVSSHMVRLYKVLDALLSLHETVRFDATPALSRTLIEIVINLDFMSRAQDMGTAARGFVCRSIRERLNPVEHFECRVKVPLNPSSPTDAEIRAFIASIRPVVRAKGDANLALVRAGLQRDGDDPTWVFDPAHAGEYLKAWPKTVFDRAKGSETGLTLYKDWFARYSLATHPNWVVMHEQDLARPNDSPCVFNSYPNPLNVIDPASWAAAAALRFANSVGAAKELVFGLEQYLDFFVRAAGLVPFFPSMTDEELDRLIEAAEAAEDS